MKFLYTGLFVLLISMTAFSQEVTISGTLRDAETGETLIGANIYVPELKTGVSTNLYGFYSLSVPINQDITVQFSYTGYQSQEKKFNTKEDIVYDLAGDDDATPDFNDTSSLGSAIEVTKLINHQLISTQINNKAREEIQIASQLKANDLYQKNNYKQAEKSYTIALNYVDVSSKSWFEMRDKVIFES